MLAAKQVNPTRMELTRLKKKRITAIRGHKLLKDKRDELMRQYLDLVRENMEVRLRVEEGILSANRNFVIARAGMSEAALNTALMAPKQEVGLIVDEKNVKMCIRDRGKTAAASIGIVAKKPEQFGKAMLFPAMVETYAILALLISFLAVSGIQL